VRTRHISHKRLKSVQWFKLGAIARKKYRQHLGRKYTFNTQVFSSKDRTGQQKSHKKSNISHIWSQAPRKDIAMKFGIGVDVHDIVAWAEFDFLNLRGVNFTGGYNLGFSIDYVYRP